MTDINEYDDIIGLSNPLDNNTLHPRMPLNQRAAVFHSFEPNVAAFSISDTEELQTSAAKHLQQ